MQGLNTKELCIEVASYMDELNKDIDQTVNTKINVIQASTEKEFNQKLAQIKADILKDVQITQIEQKSKFAEQFEDS
jgi:hypothetical protein